MSSNNEKEYIIELGQCSGDKDGNLYYTEPKGENIITEVIANHTPFVDCIKRIDDGFSIEEKIQLHALRNGKHEKPVYADKKSMRGNTPDVMFSPGCYIYPGRNHVSRYSLFIFQQCDKENKVETIHTHTGWKRTDDGKLIYLNGKNGIDENGLNPNWAAELPEGLTNFEFYPVECSEHEALQTVVEGMKQAMPDWVHVPLLAYVFLTPLNFMLREKGKEPCFSFYIIGKTGTYKSSTSKVLLNFFGKFNYATTAPITFTDTVNTMEKKLSLGADIPLLADDRRPTNNYIDKITYESKEKALSAYIGDRVGRGRLNADGSSRKTFIPRSNLIVTAEEAYVNIGSSSIARSLSVELQKDTINFPQLEYLQEHPDHFNKVMQMYIQFIIRNYVKIDNASDNLLKAYREVAHNKGHARLATNFSQLMFGYRIFLSMLVAYEYITEDEMKQHLIEAEKIFLTMCDQQDKRIYEDTPTVMFISLLKEMIAIGRVYIKDLRKTYSERDLLAISRAQCIGYRDEEFVYLHPQEVYNEVYKYYGESGNIFHASRTSLWKMLLDEGKLVPQLNKQNEIVRVDKRKLIDGKSGRYIHLFARVLDNDDEEGGEYHE